MTDVPNNAEQHAESNTPTQAQNEHMIPKSRLDAVIAERRELAEKLAQHEATAKLRVETELAEQSRWQELAEQRQNELAELKAVEAQASSYKSALEATNQARLEQVPEDKRSLVPNYGDPVKLGAWFDANLELLREPKKPLAPNLNGGSGAGAGNSSGVTLSNTQQSLLEFARQSTGLALDTERTAERARKPQKQTKTIEG
jgi:hypothetical protein